MKFVPARASRFISRQKLKINSGSPTILLVAGITGVVGTTVLASRATLKAQPVLQATALELDELQYQVDKGEVRYTEHELRKHRLAIYTKTAGQLTRLYGPTIILGTVSIGCLITGHRILNDRYTAMSAAYVALQESLESYRKRISDEYGADKERELFYDVQDVTYIEPGPNGPKKTTVKQAGLNGGSVHARLFNAESSTEFKNTPEYNIMFLRQVEKHCNERLRRDGHMFLNRVFEELGMEDTGPGARVGWLYERGTGDDSIDFGIWSDDMKDRLYDFMVGNEGEIMLDFNVDGPIDHLLHLPKIKG